MTKQKISRLFTVIIVAVGAISMLAPFLWMISTSLKTDPEVFTFPPTWLPDIPQWKNYLNVFNIANFGKYFSNSMFISITTTLFALLFNTMAGYAFAKFNFRGKEVIFVLLLATMMIPFQITMIPIYLLYRELNLINTYTGLILPGMASAFGIFMMRQFMTSIPDDLLDAARVDGASEARIFLQIVLPMSKAPIAALGIFTFMGVWNDYFRPLVLITKEELKTLPLFISSLSSGLYVQSWPLVMAAATVATLPVIIVFLFFQKYFIQSLSMTGLK